MRDISDICGRVRVGYELLDLSQKDKFLDIGCAWGYLEKRLVCMGLKNIVAIDVRKNAISKAKKDVKGATFSIGSATNLPFKEESFDKVSLFDVIEHIPIDGDAIALSQVNRLLKKNGTLVVSVPNKGFLNMCQYMDAEYLLYGHRHYSKEELILLLEKCNFKTEYVFIGGGVISHIFLNYVRLFFSVINKPFKTSKIIDGINSKFDHFEDKLYNNDRKNGYSLIIKAKKIKNVMDTIP